jgi:hypothetical protein
LHLHLPDGTAGLPLFKPAIAQGCMLKVCCPEAGGNQQLVLLSLQGVTASMHSAVE